MLWIIHGTKADLCEVDGANIEIAEEVGVILVTFIGDILICVCLGWGE